MSAPARAASGATPPSFHRQRGGEPHDAIVRVFRSWERQCYRSSDRPDATPATATAGTTGTSTTTTTTTTTHDALREQAREFFSSILRSTHIQVDDASQKQQQKLQTHSSHEQMLALLLQQLQGPFKAVPQHDDAAQDEFIVVNARVSALFLLIGALEGISSGGAAEVGEGGSTPSAASSGLLSLALFRLVGTFLLAHCGPLRLSPRSESDSGAARHQASDTFAEDGYGADATPVREAAVVAVTALLRCGTKMAEGDEPADDERSVLEESAAFRLSLARRAVESRCAADDDEAEIDADEAMDDEVPGTAPSQYRTLNGLSSLPRSKRSQLFELIRAAIESIQQAQPRDASVLSIVGASDFCRFAASLLLGESDPRCLLQLLEIFGLMAQVLQAVPTALETRHRPGGSHSLPWDHILEAVAPYYPIQFTPPPNNVHRITKLQLRQALIAVFRVCTHVEAFSDMVELVLERVLDDENADAMGGGGSPTALTVEEQREAVQDLTWLLLGSFNNGTESSDVGSIESPVKSTTSNRNFSTKVRYVDDNVVRRLSNALLAIFRSASREMVRKPDPESPTYRVAKETLELCRNLVSLVARDCEAESSASTTSSHWSAFVEEPVEALTAQLSTPTRVSVAYLACLASSGGNKTLRYVLDESLSKLLEKDFEAFDDPGTAIYGIGAFFSACDTSIHIAEKHGVSLYPHPLKPYRAKVVHKLSALMIDPDRTVTARQGQMSGNQSVVYYWNLRIASVRAMESVFLASPSSHLDDNEVDALSSFIRALVDPILVSEHNAKSEDLRQQGNGDENSFLCPESLVRDWLSSCSKTLGSLLGQTVIGHAGNESKLDRLVESEPVNAIADIAVIPPMLESVATPTSATSRPRYDHLCLATACSMHPSPAAFIIGKLVDALLLALSQSNLHTAEACSAALNEILRKGGVVAVQAYHSLKEPRAALNIIEAISAIAKAKGDSELRMNSEVGLSAIRLPATVEELTKDRSNISHVYKLATALRPAYLSSHLVPSHALHGLLKLAELTLPPLTLRDAATLAVVLPLLSAALSSSHAEATNYADVQQLLSDLAELCFSIDFHSSARAHAYLCTRQLISNFTPTEVECPALRLLNAFVVPALKNVIQSKKGISMGPPSLSDTFAFMSVLASAAACRGSSSARTADEVALFFVDVACAMRGTMFGGTNDSFVFDVSSTEGSDEWSKDIVVEAATCVCSILSTRIPPLSRQRLTTKVLTRLAEFESDERSPAVPNSVGLLITTCQVACASNLQNFGPSNLKQVVGATFAGLEKIDATLRLVSSRNRYEVKMLLLTTLLKLIAVTPADAANNPGPLLTGVLRCFAAEAQPTQDIAVKLLALQVLDSMANAGLKEMAAFRPAVISVLSGAMNHPSSLIRQASVDVRNTWFTLGQM